MSARVKQAAATLMLCHLAYPRRSADTVVPIHLIRQRKCSDDGRQQASLTLKSLKNPLFSKARKVGEGLKTDLT